MYGNIMQVLGLVYLVLFTVSVLSTEIRHVPIKFLDAIVRLKQDKSSLIELLLCILISSALYTESTHNADIGIVASTGGWLLFAAMKFVEIKRSYETRTVDH